VIDLWIDRDWKKLTFYYFADAYINFNSLVTDLFKIYKTRIWMSAINPASFASPAFGLQAPSGVGPGAVGVTRPANAVDRRQNQPQDGQPGYQSPTQPGRPFAGAANQGLNPDRPAVPAPAYQAPNYPYNPYGVFSGMPRPGAMPYVAMQGLESYPAAYGRPSDYQALQGRFPSPQAAGPQHDAAVSPLPGQVDWTGAFQGLSLNSR
jgi:hypothetical protein